MAGGSKDSLENFCRDTTGRGNNIRPERRFERKGRRGKAAEDSGEISFPPHNLRHLCVLFFPRASASVTDPMRYRSTNAGFLNGYRASHFALNVD